MKLIKLRNLRSWYQVRHHSTMVCENWNNADRPRNSIFPRLAQSRKKSQSIRKYRPRKTSKCWKSNTRKSSKASKRNWTHSVSNSSSSRPKWLTKLNPCSIRYNHSLLQNRTTPWMQDKSSSKLKNSVRNSILWTRRKQSCFKSTLH